MEKLYCPRCNKLMNQLSYKGVDIEKCPSCHGVWLDKGEEYFVAEILRSADTDSCRECLHFDGKNRCNLLKIVVSRDFHCTHFSAT